MKELAADGIPVAVSCRVLKLSRQPYYRWLAVAVTVAEHTAAVRANALFDAHRDDPEFGYRFLADEANAAVAEIHDHSHGRSGDVRADGVADLSRQRPVDPHRIRDHH